MKGHRQPSFFFFFLFFENLLDDERPREADEKELDVHLSYTVSEWGKDNDMFMCAGSRQNHRKGFSKMIIFWMIPL